MYGLIYKDELIYVDENYESVKEEFDGFVKNENCKVEYLKIKEVECSIEKYEIDDEILDDIVQDIMNHYTDGDEDIAVYFNEVIDDCSVKSLKFLLDGVIDIWIKKNGLDMRRFIPKE